MKAEVLYPGAFALAKLHLEQGELAKAESGAMMSMSPTVDVESKMEGGMFAALKRSVLSGEKFFFQTLKASRGAGHALVAPDSPGDIAILELNGSNGFWIQKDGFLAASDTVTIESKSQGIFKGLFSGEGMFLLQASGKGLLLVNSFGSIHEVNLAAGEEYIVDNGHLVAWSTTTNYEIKKASSGWISSLTSGEGVVCHFKGPGRILTQTRNAGAFGGWLQQFIPHGKGD